jgi:hypothetical protein
MRKINLRNAKYFTPNHRPETHCYICSASSKEQPIYPVHVPIYTPSGERSTLLDKNLCMSCWEEIYEAEIALSPYASERMPNGDWHLYPRVKSPSDENQCTPPTSLTIKGHQWPLGHETIFPPEISSQELNDKIEAMTSDFLNRGGMRDAWMLDANVDHPRSLLIYKKLPPVIKKAVRDLLSGIRPKPQGFVLGGPSNAGKTGALAAWTCSWAMNVIRRHGPNCGLGKPDNRHSTIQNTWFAWLDWPNTYIAWRYMEDDQHRMNDLRLVWEPLSTCPLLIIDDLGNETANPHFGVPVVEEALARMIDRRSSENRITLVTTNLSEADLRNYLGERTANRLLDSNPYVALPGNLPPLSRCRV